MQAHILSLHTPSTSGVGSKVKIIFFRNVVMLHIKLEKNGAYSTMQVHILSLHTFLISGGGGGQMSKKNSEVVVLHIKLNGMNYRAPCNTYSVLTHNDYLNL